ncbi:hypothetical protein OESDEN_14277 [Oesophagostomum dentatum]|uniref:Uncharacterized protein n=1 Tax=Oesophagostomum dentatum TaxID=61180 RepID=A0A0B1SRY6_OESDE|nr:hypothetical protein OESDEN_14277 [Oesophagostomum dentatum]
MTRCALRCLRHRLSRRPRHSVMLSLKHARRR